MNRLLNDWLLAVALLAAASACTADPAPDPLPGDPVAAAASGDRATGDRATGERATGEPDMNDSAPSDRSPSDPARTEVATFGAGCYWCVEAVLEQLDGVLDVRSGFMGGHVDDPSYEAVCSGTTGHAEVVRVEFDPAKLGYGDLLKWFFKLHDPTTVDRQGNDIGPQYRSVIFHHSDAQRDAAIAAKAAAQQDFVAPIVTEIAPASTFWEAKVSHQDYYRQNKGDGYCRFVIAPKLDKLGLEK